MKKFSRSSSDFHNRSSSSTNGKPRGFYDVLVQACVKNTSNIAVRVYDDGKYTCYTYSEMFGVCEYISQNLQHLSCNQGVIALVSQRNIIVPCAVAAVHKCCTSFMFLDPTAEIAEISKDINFTAIISIIPSFEQSISAMLSKEPERTITVFNHTLNFYYYGPPSDKVYRNIVEHSFICRTSGSTGAPKNILVPVECIQPNINDLTNLFEINSNDVIFFSTPLTFDPSMVEILLACKNGASLLIAPCEEEVMFPKNKEHSVTVWQTTPSKFFQNTDLMTRALSANSTLRVLALGGEPFRGLRRIKKLKHPKNVTKIFILYGVTEMSCWACAAELDLDKYSTDQEVPLGRCLSETEIIVQQESKESAQGNIILVSKTRKCVILRRDKTGAEWNSLKFVDTGDIGNIKNGTIYYQGRTDDQIKRFGHKVNLLTIESVVHQCPNVKACSCIWLPKPRLLVVYFSSDSINSKELSDFLKCKLDDKQWPDKIIRIDHLPTNAHEKTSKAVLKNLYDKIPSLDALKLKLLQEIKGFHDKKFTTYDDIKHNNFYALGGTSFRAVTIANKISLSDAHFGKFLLTHLLSPKLTIDQIMKLADQTLLRRDMQTDSLMIPKAMKSQKMVKSNLTSKRRASQSDGFIISNEEQAPKKMAMTSSQVAPSMSEDIEIVLLWRYDTGKCVDAAPTLCEYNLTLYVAVGSHSGKIVVVDALYGSCDDVIDVAARIEASVYCYHDTDTGLAYGVVGAYDGTIVCFRLDTCEVKWRTNIDCMIKSKATMYKSVMYVAAYDGCIYCINSKTGQVTQQIQISKDEPISADLVLAKGQFILTGTLSGTCACLNAHSNAIVWRAPLASPLFAAPALYDRGKYVVFAEVNGNVHCRTVDRGVQIWKFSCAKGNIFSSCYITQVDRQNWKFIFGCHDNSVYCVTVKHHVPSLAWTCPVSTPVYATPTGLNSTMILAASTDGKLNVIDIHRGNIIYQYSLPSETFSSPAVFEDYVYVGCRDDHLYALRFVLKTPEIT